MYIFKEIMLTIYPLTLWSQNVLTKNFWSKMNFSNRIINSFQTSWNKLAKLNVDVANTLYTIPWRRDLWTILPISQKPHKISNWNFTCILQRHIGIRKYQNLNFDQVPHLDPKSHGWSQLSSRYLLVLYVNCSVKRQNFAPKWSISYIQPILAAFFVNIATVKVKLISDLYTWTIVLINY